MTLDLAHRSLNRRARDSRGTYMRVSLLVTDTRTRRAEPTFPRHKFVMSHVLLCLDDRTCFTHKYQKPILSSGRLFSSISQVTIKEDLSPLQSYRAYQERKDHFDTSLSLHIFYNLRRATSPAMASIFAGIRDFFASIFNLIGALFSNAASLVSHAFHALFNLISSIFSGIGKVLVICSRTSWALS